MKRREFIQAATLAGFSLSGAASTLGLESVRRELNHFIADGRATADVDDWQEIALDYGQTYPATIAVGTALAGGPPRSPSVRC